MLGLFHCLVSYCLWFSSWKLEAPRSARHATKEDRGAGQSSLVSEHKAWVTALKGGPGRSEASSVWPAALQIKRSGAGGLLCLTGVAPLVCNASFKEIKTQVTSKEFSWVYMRSRLSNGVQLYHSTSRHNLWVHLLQVWPHFPSQTHTRWHAEDTSEQSPRPNKGKWFHNGALSDRHAPRLSVWQSNFLIPCIFMSWPGEVDERGGERLVTSGSGG